MLTGNPVGELNRDIATLKEIEAVGGTLPPTVWKLIHNWETFAARIEIREAEQRLVTEMASGKDLTPKQVENLWSAALLDKVHDDGYETRRKVAGALRTALRAAYREKAAEQNYKVAATRLDEAAATLTEAIRTVDPETPPEQLLGKDDAIQQVYLKQPLHAAEMDDALSFFYAAAELAGKPVGGTEDQISLLIDWSKAHRRRVWEAWHTTGRAGKWTAILATGATIRAQPLADTTRFEELAPMEVRQIPGELGIRQVDHDPEDDEYEGRMNAGKKGGKDTGHAA